VAGRKPKDVPELQWINTVLGKHTRKSGHFHATVELIHLSLHFGLPVDSSVVAGC
jgi:hypothetical protein